MLVALCLVIDAVVHLQLASGYQQSSSSFAELVGFWRVASLGCGVIFLAESGDLTQILTADLTSNTTIPHREPAAHLRHHHPASVAIGATRGLWAVGLLAILGGKTVLAVLPLKWMIRIAAVVTLALGIYSLVTAVNE